MGWGNLFKWKICYFCVFVMYITGSPSSKFSEGKQMINDTCGFSNCLFLFSRFLYLPTWSIHEDHERLSNKFQGREESLMCLVVMYYVHNFYRFANGGTVIHVSISSHHSHWWNLVGSMLYLDVTIKHLFVKTHKAPFGSTNTFFRNIQGQWASDS